MKILTISGSYRRGKTVETLIDKAVEGILSVRPDAEIQKIRLMDKKIEYCMNCQACRRDNPEKEIALCAIKDDVPEICYRMNEADAFVFGTPIMDADLSAIFKAFMERCTWVLAKPGDTFPIKGCPVPRNSKKKKSILIMSSGLVPPIFRMFCDYATPMLSSFCECCFHLKPVGSLYAGAVETRGLEAYLNQAINLGKKLVN